MKVRLVTMRTTSTSESPAEVDGMAKLVVKRSTKLVRFRAMSSDVFGCPKINHQPSSLICAPSSRQSVEQQHWLEFVASGRRRTMNESHFRAKNSDGRRFLSTYLRKARDVRPRACRTRYSSSRQPNLYWQWAFRRPLPHQFPLDIQSWQSRPDLNHPNQSVKPVKCQKTKKT